MNTKTKTVKSETVATEIDNALDMALAELDTELGIDEVPTETVVEDSNDDVLEALEQESEISDLDALLDSIDEDLKDDSIDALNNGSMDAKIEASNNETMEQSSDFSSAEETELAPKAVKHEKSLVVEASDSESDDTTDPTPVAKIAPEKSIAALKPKSRASGATTPFQALAQRLGGVKALESNIVLSTDDVERDLSELLAEFETTINGLAKKVGEKAVNLIAHLQGSATLSVYTVIAIEMLVKDGKLTQRDLVNRYLDRPYSLGTSRSQAGQMMQLLPALKIAKKTGRGELELDPNSVIMSVLGESVAA